MALTVTQPFADYVIGQVITDATQIAAIKASEQVRFVVQTADPTPTPVTQTKTD